MDWAQVVTEINGAGVTIREIVRQTGAKSPGTIAAIKAGKTDRPSYDLGVALLDLHKRTMRKAARQAAKS